MKGGCESLFNFANLKVTRRRGNLFLNKQKKLTMDARAIHITLMVLLLDKFRNKSLRLQ